ncbi:MAG: hypothetical protein Q9164_002179 [Protoblastenia rupestris]
MSIGEVIDLLSSGDEATALAYVPSKEDVAPEVARAGDFLFLDDDFDSTADVDHAWATAPTKRRRLSPSSNKSSLPSLPSDGEDLAKHNSSTIAAGSKTKNDDTWTRIDDADPIIFTSSVHYSTAISRPAKLPADTDPDHSDGSDDSLPDDILRAVPPHSNFATLSERTTALLTSLNQPGKLRKPHKRSAVAAKRSNIIHSGDTVTGTSMRENDGDASEQHHASKPKKSKLTEEEHEARAREKDKAKADRARERDLTKEQKSKSKEEDKERKRLQREEKANEKRIAAELAEVNKSKLDKKDSTPEMIVDLPASIDGTSVDTQAREFLKNLGVGATLYQSIVPNLVKWRRKMKARWNAELDHWEPLEHMVIEDEQHVLCLMSAKAFISLATLQNEEEEVETHVAKIKSAHDGCIPIYLIEGLQIYMRKNKTAENRAYQAKVLNQSQEGGETSAQQSKRKKPLPEQVDEDVIEDALLRLQVMNGCLIHHVNTAFESAEWIANYTQHISTIPYR